MQLAAKLTQDLSPTYSDVAELSDSTTGLRNNGYHAYRTAVLVARKDDVPLSTFDL